MNGVDLRNDESGSADLLTSATIGPQLRVYDGVPQTTLQAVKLQTVRFPWLTDSEQQCRQLQEIRTCRTSKSRQPFCCNNLSATSFTLTPPTPVSSSSSSPVDRSQPLYQESLRPTGGAGIKATPDVALFLTKRVIHGVCRCVVLTGSEHIACPIPADVGVFVMFISGGKFSAGSSRFVASIERSLVSSAAGRHTVPDHE